MDPRLVEIADALASEPVSMGLGGNRLTRFAGSREGALATVAGFVGAFSLVARQVKSAINAADSQEAREMYEAVTGVGPARASEDLAFVSERLAPFATVGALSKYPTTTARRVALELVVAAAHADRLLPETVTVAWDHWLLFLRARDHNKTELLQAASAYASAWEAVLAA